jgi:deoxyadenosine/deoxycytidine kinase
MKDGEGRNILELFYADIDRWSYTFQHVTLMTRIANTSAVVKEAQGTNAVIVMERSILTDRYVFAEMLRAQGKLNPLEWDLYQRWYDLLTGFMPIDGIIHLDTDVETCIERIKLRARPGEVTPEEYLRDLDAAHRSWLSDTSHPVLSLSTTDGSTHEDRVRIVLDFIQHLRQRQTSPPGSPIDALYSTPVKKGSRSTEVAESPNAINDLADDTKDSMLS